MISRSSEWSLVEGLWPFAELLSSCVAAFKCPLHAWDSFRLDEREKFQLKELSIRTAINLEAFLVLIISKIDPTRRITVRRGREEEKKKVKHFESITSEWMGKGKKKKRKIEISLQSPRRRTAKRKKRNKTSGQHQSLTHHQRRWKIVRFFYNFRSAWNRREEK